MTAVDLGPYGVVALVRAPVERAGRGCGKILPWESVEHRERGVHQYPHADRERGLVDVEGRLVQVHVRSTGRGRPHAEPSQRAGDVPEVPGEVLAAEALLGVGDRLRPQGGLHARAE